jgi:hypothetical protein
VESFAPIEIIRFERVSKTWASILRSDQICYNAFFRRKGPLKYMSDLGRISGEVNPWNRRLKSLFRKENAWLKKGPEMTFSLTMISENWHSMFSDGESDGRNGVGTLYQDGRIVGKTKDGVSIFSLLDFTYRTIRIPELENFEAIKLGGDHLLVKSKSKELHAYDCVTTSLKYTFGVPFTERAFACNNDLFTAVSSSGLIIWDGKTGKIIENINLLDLMVEPPDIIIDEYDIVDEVDIAIANDNTIIVRQHIFNDSDDGHGEDRIHRFYFISAFDTTVREHFDVPYEGISVWEKSTSGNMMIGSMKSKYHVGFIVCDRDHDFDTWHNIHYNSSTCTYHLRAPLQDCHAKTTRGIAPEMACLLYESDFQTAGVSVEVLVDSRWENDDLIQYELPETIQTLQEFWADQDWIIARNNNILCILGFDEDKCKSLKKWLDNQNLDAKFSEDLVYEYTI